MTQQTFTDVEYDHQRIKTRRRQFLEDMERIIPWKLLIDIITPHYYSKKRGRPPVDLETMLRMYLVQNWFHLSDRGTEEEIADSYAIRQFLKINFFDRQAPDATPLLKFRRLIEKNNLAEKIFSEINSLLEKAGLMMRCGSIVDATIISAPSSTKNHDKKRDPEMHQTKKGNQWHFGMKVHIGVDAGSGYVHTITGTAANVHDLEELPHLVRSDDEVVYGDAGYTGASKRAEIQDDDRLKNVEFIINRRPSSMRCRSRYQGIDWDKQIEKRKSSIRSKVEHPFLIVKRLFSYAKTSYRGIAKNMNRLHILFAFANLVMCSRAGRREEFCSVW